MRTSETTAEDTVINGKPFPSPGDYFVGALLSMIPAYLAGSFAGFYSREMEPLFVIGIVCAMPIAVLAFVAPRWWYLPGFVFCAAFHSGFHVFDGLGETIFRIVSLPLVIFTGTRPSHQTPPPIEDSLWFYSIVAIVGFASAALRLYARHPITSEGATEEIS
jgi:hypothetical protein